MFDTEKYRYSEPETVQRECRAIIDSPFWSVTVDDAFIDMLRWKNEESVTRFVKALDTTQWLESKCGYDGETELYKAGPDSWEWECPKCGATHIESGEQ